jgi:copper homeostasis protein
VDDVLGSGGAGSENIATVVGNLLRCGFGAVLTSGGPGNAADNLPVLEQFACAVNGKMEIVIGGGVRTANKKAIVDSFGHLGNVWLHSSCLSKGRVDEEELRGLLDDV